MNLVQIKLSPQIKPPLAFTARNPCCDERREGIDCQKARLSRPPISGRSQMQRVARLLGLFLCLTCLANVALAQASKVKLGDLVGEFEAPPLAELEKKVKWVSRPVL